MLAQLVTKLKRADSSRAELTTSRVSSRATSILFSPKHALRLGVSVRIKFKSEREGKTNQTRIKANEHSDLFSEVRFQRT
jgi:hypothetical protein